MNQTIAHFDRLFVDRPVISQPENATRVSSLRLICQDRTDYAEAAIRLFLMLCIPAALCLGGMRVNAPAAGHPAARFRLPAWTAAGMVPALPKGPIRASIR